MIISYRYFYKDGDLDNYNLIYEVKFNERDMVYKTNKPRDSYIILGLELICGYDYVNPDYSNVQGYVSADHFIDDVQYEQVVCYFITESVENALVENGYEIIDRLPKIYK